MILYTAGLVTIAADKTAVRIQLSLHEYLKNQGQQWFPEAELEIAERLLTYLNNESMTRTGSRELDNNVQNRLEKFPLLSIRCSLLERLYCFRMFPPGRSITAFFLLGHSLKIVHPSILDHSVEAQDRLGCEEKVDWTPFGGIVRPRLHHP